MSCNPIVKNDKILEIANHEHSPHKGIALAIGIIFSLGGIAIILIACQVIPNPLMTSHQIKVIVLTLGVASCIIGCILIGYEIISAKTPIQNGNANSLTSNTRIVTQDEEEKPELSVDHQSQEFATPLASQIPAAINGELQEKLINVQSLKRLGEGSNREVYHIKDSGWVFKTNKHPHTPLPYFSKLNEHLAYAISEQLNYGYIPEIYSLSPDSAEYNLISQRTGKKPLLLQKYIPRTRNPLNVPQTHRTMMFIWVLGMKDPNENCEIDEDGNLWIIDTELLFGKAGQLPHMDRLAIIYWIFDLQTTKNNVNIAIAQEELDWVLSWPDTITIDREKVPDGKGCEKEKYVTQAEHFVNTRIKILKNIVRDLQAQGSCTCKELEAKILSEETKLKALK